jgi:hypothetical protein
MSDLDDWKARKVPFDVPVLGNGVRFIRCGLGRKGQQWSYGGVPRDCVIAREWEDLGEAALTAEYAQFNAADLAGRMVGQAFLEQVIRDSKVQAAGKWLCLERTNFSQLFEEGMFPAVTHDHNQRRSSIRTQHRSAYANVAYPHLKESLRGLPRGTLSNSDRSFTTFDTTRPSSSVVWDQKWPLLLDANKLTEIFSSEYSSNANYQDDPFEGPIYHAAKALADRHQAFFDLLRSRFLVAEGTFRDTGQQLQVPDKQWSRLDRYLDVQNSDLFNKKDEVANVIWESVTLRLPNQEAIAGRSATAANVTFPHPTSASPPSLSAEGDASALSSSRKRGRRVMVVSRVEEAMKCDINEGRHTPESLANMLEKHMEAKYSASRDSCRKARNKVLSEISPGK